MNVASGWDYTCESAGWFPLVWYTDFGYSTSYFLGLFIGPVIAGNIAER